ncbi:MAG: acyltransferase [Methylococcales bacterium]|nr:acyltransferase [Methylococcales bacterium]
MKNRLVELDGLRGIAAFMVFLSHVIGLLAVTRFVNFYHSSPARIISDGAAAVDIFFVLSGFVLSLPFIDQKKSLNYFSFVIKRMFRLFPTYWICILLTIYIKNQYNPSGMEWNGLSEWARTLWIKPITESDILRHLPLIMKTDFHVIDPVAWTLAIEMKMSLLLPILIFWVKKWDSILSQTLLILTSVVLSYLTGKLEYLPLFAIGLILSIHWRQFKIINSTHFFKLLILFTLTLILIGNRFLLPFNYNNYISHTQSLITALGAALFIPIAIFWSGVNNFLKHPGIDFLGKISYSFYLYHFPFLLVSVSILYPIYESMLISAIVSLFLTIIISFLSYKFIESKSMTIYKKLIGLVAIRIGRN